MARAAPRCRTPPPLAAATLVALLVLAAGVAGGAQAAMAKGGEGVVVSDACAPPDFDGAVQRFSELLQFKTVSTVDTPTRAVDEAEFAGLDAFLQGAYPLVWERLEVEKVGVGGLSYLFTWPGSDASLRPVLLVSHIDVVPVTPGSEQDWTHPPFSGAVADGYVWGRGAIDIKSTVVCILEAASWLLRDGWAPSRTLMFAFGQDEEVGGNAGAVETVKLLAARGVELEVVWDEGSPITLDGMKPFLSQATALVATAEKGYQSVEVRISSRGGHSSMPPIDGSSVADVLGRLLSRFTAAPPPPKLSAPVRDMLRSAAAYAPGWLSLVLRSVGVVPGMDALLARAMAAAGAEAAALVRTTVAVTNISAGVAHNVLPQSGFVGVNLRLLPGDDGEGMLRYLKGLIPARDRRVVSMALVKPHMSVPASKVTPADGAHFKLLKQAIQEVWQLPDGAALPVLPFLMPGGTDSTAYLNRSAAGALRFAPHRAGAADARRVHGTDERLSLDDLRGGVCTFRHGLELFGSWGGAGGRAHGRAEAGSLHGWLAGWRSLLLGRGPRPVATAEL